MPKQNNIVYIGFFAEINTGNIQNFLGTIASKLPEKTDELYILFDTVGGNVSDGFVLYNILRGLPYKITMHNVGSVDSIGIVIFLAAGKRYANKNGTFLIHSVKSSTKNDNATEDYYREKLDSIRNERNKIEAVIRERTGISEKDLKELFHAGELKDSEYALSTGIIHEIRDITIPKDAHLLVVQASRQDE